MTEEAGRLGDEGSESGLLIQTDDQGDIYITVKQQWGASSARTTTRFCTLQGGGRSPKVRRALVALMDAIKEENERDPLATWQ